MAVCFCADMVLAGISNVSEHARLKTRFIKIESEKLIYRLQGQEVSFKQEMKLLEK